MYNFNSPYASIEDTLSIIRLSVDGSIVDAYPFLLEVQAWSAFVEGRGADMEGYLDRYFKQLTKIIIQNPASIQTSMLLRCMDYRNTLINEVRNLKKLPLKYFGLLNTPSLTQNMPFAHRSSRDYSEFLKDKDENLELFRKTIGVLIGLEYDSAELALRAGFSYEQGDLDKAYEFALSSVAALKDSFAPEMQFCSYMILSAILEAQGNSAESQRNLNITAAMIESHKAYYLNANFRAFYCRTQLANGDAESAKSWLNHDAESPHSNLSFYKLYQHFTTARALIVTGDYNSAILLLKKLLILNEQYRRPLDIMESNILLAIAYWKKVRSSQDDALEFLEKAIITAREYKYTQLFINDGADLTNMLHKLQKRVIQKDYS